VSHGVVPMIGFFVGVIPALALAQTNLDQGKTPAQMFASDCAACHKTTRGLATGRSGAMLTGFLREHYMTSPEQAAAMAAYVLAAGGSESVPPTQGKGQKPAIEHAAVPSEERKPAYRQARRPARLEEEAPASAKLQRSTDATKPEDKESHAEELRHGPSARSSAAVRHESEPPRTHRGETEPPVQQVTAAPTTATPPTTSAPPPTSETSGQETAPTQGPTAAAPSEAQPGENSAVPRDDIPD
jgi:hypothetical protein